MAELIALHRRRQKFSLVLALLLLAVLMLRVGSAHQTARAERQLAGLQSEQHSLRLLSSRLQLEKYALLSPAQLEKAAQAGDYVLPEGRVYSLSQSADSEAGAAVTTAAGDR